MNIKEYFKEKKNIIAAISIVTYIALMIGLPILIQLILVKTTTLDFRQSHKSVLMLVLNITCYVPLFLAMLFLNKIIIKEDLIECRDNTATLSKNIIRSIIIFYLVCVLLSIFTIIIKAGKSENQEGINCMVSDIKPGLPVMFFLTVIFAPVIEELVFRKSLFQLIKNKYASLIISSIAFGFIHMTSQKGTFIEVLAVAIPYIGQGLTLGLIYEKNNRNITIPIVVHMFNNFIALASLSMI